MVKLSDYWFKVGKFETYIYRFIVDGVKYEEYVHCVVDSVLEYDRDENPKIIKVKQILNLKEWAENKKDFEFKYREFRVIELIPISKAT